MTQHGAGRSPMTVAEYIVAYLAALGVRHFFGVSGANIEDLYDAAQRSDGLVRPVLAKHEFSAATMADGASRSAARLGVVVSTSGGGAMNLIAGLAESYTSRVPVLALVGQISSQQEGRGGFQDSSGMAGSLDAESLFATVTRSCIRARSAHGFQKLLHDSIVAALAEPTGPAVLLLPKDVQQAEINCGDPYHMVLPKPRPTGPSLSVVRNRKRLASLIDSCRRTRDQVVIIAGAGVGISDSRAELAALVDKLDARVALAPDGKDAFDNGDQRFLGVAGVMGHPAVERALRRARVCLLVGTRLPSIARAGLEHALATTQIVAIGCEASHVSDRAGVGETLEITSDLRAELRWLLTDCPSLWTSAMGNEVYGRDEFLPQGRVAKVPPSHVSYRQVMQALGTAIPRGANVFVDAGNVGAAAVHYLDAPRDGRFVVALGMGGMGYSFGASIGAAMTTGRRTYVIAGDGSFYMHGFEIHTAAEYELPVTFVVLNNNAHAMCFAREKIFYGEASTLNRFKPANLAAGIGAMFPAVEAFEARTASQVREALRAANARNGPSFVAVDVSADELPPFLPFLKPSAPASLPAKENSHEDRRKQAS